MLLSPFSRNERIRVFINSQMIQPVPYLYFTAVELAEAGSMSFEQSPKKHYQFPFLEGSQLNPSDNRPSWMKLAGPIRSDLCELYCICADLVLFHCIFLLHALCTFESLAHYVMYDLINI